MCYGRLVTPQTPPSLGHDGLACREFLDALSTFARLHAVKMHRLSVPLAEEVPLLPCLDHEATLHEGVPPHAAAYIEDLGRRRTARGGLRSLAATDRGRRGLDRR